MPIPIILYLHLNFHYFYLFLLLVSMHLHSERRLELEHTHDSIQDIDVRSTLLIRNLIIRFDTLLYRSTSLHVQGTKSSPGLIT